MTDLEFRTTAELIDHMDAGHRPDFIFFWGHKKAGPAMTQACLSQWYEAPFVVGGDRYPTAEHFMMAEKARLFGDSDSRSRILGADDPRAAKAFGRGVAGFDTTTWDAHKVEIVVRGNLAKFAQNAELKAYLLGTAGRVLVEASPVDAIWGVGLAAEDVRIHDPRQWQGANLMGFALMTVRRTLSADA